ncbi:MAG: LysR family transcriptional regulator, partial [Azorhizobium sp. 32-67-21]
MDLRQLRYFVTIVETGSFSKAAQRLHVAQPALSQHVRNMELDLGVELLFRSSQGVVPTEAGETLVRHARLILSQMEAAREAVRGSEGQPEG